MRGTTNLPDYYATLQVHPEAEGEVIEAAYRRLARKYHPDVNPNPSADSVMSQINEAHRILSNAVLRAEYDAAIRRERMYTEEPQPQPMTYPIEVKRRVTWWRWLLVLPAFAFGFFVPGFLIGLLYGAFLESQTWKMMVQSFAGGWCAVLLPSYVAPKGKDKVALLSGLVLAVLVGVGSLATWMVWHEKDGWEKFQSVASLLVSLAGAGMATWQVMKDGEDAF